MNAAPLIRRLRSPDLDPELFECAECAAKPGSPLLCVLCLANREKAGDAWKGRFDGQSPGEDAAHLATSTCSQCGQPISYHAGSRRWNHVNALDSDRSHQDGRLKPVGWLDPWHRGILLGLPPSAPLKRWVTTAMAMFPQTSWDHAPQPINLLAVRLAELHRLYEAIVSIQEPETRHGLPVPLGVVEALVKKHDLAMRTADLWRMTAGGGRWSMTSQQGSLDGDIPEILEVIDKVGEALYQEVQKLPAATLEKLRQDQAMEPTNDLAEEAVRALMELRQAVLDKVDMIIPEEVRQIVWPEKSGWAGQIGLKWDDGYMILRSPLDVSSVGKAEMLQAIDACLGRRPAPRVFQLVKTRAVRGQIRRLQGDRQLNPATQLALFESTVSGALLLGFNEKQDVWFLVPIEKSTLEKLQTGEMPIRRPFETGWLVRYDANPDSTSRALPLLMRTCEVEHLPPPRTWLSPGNA